MMLQRVPTLLRSELYAIPALVAAAVAVGATQLHAHGTAAAVVDSVACFLIWMLGVRFDLNAPRSSGEVDE